MANEVLTITDPLGNTIKVKQHLCEIMVSTSEEEYDDVTAVIQHPALLIELTTNPIPELYYYRYIGSDNTILIAARKEEDHWEAFKCVKNPQSGFLSDLLKRGRQII